MPAKFIFKKKTNITFVIIWFLFITYSIMNRNYLAVPTSDIFQYISEGKYYSEFKLPPSIHPAPLVPFLISNLSKITKYFSNYPEIDSAHIINIFSSSFLILFVYLIVKQYSGKIALLVITLLSTNMFFVASTLNVTNEVLYGLELSIIIYLYQKRRFSLVFLLSALAFLTRYESIIVPFTIFLAEFLNNKKIKIKYLLIYFIPVLTWLTILTYVSHGSIFNSPYILDIKNSGKNFINILPFLNISEVLLLGPTFYYTDINIVKIIKTIFIISLLFLVVKNIKDKKVLPVFKISYTILLIHIISISFFPYYYPKYSFSIYWILYLLFVDQKNKLISILIILILAITNLFNFGKPNSFLDPNYQIQYRHIANWINQEEIKENSIVIIFEPWVLEYYIKNPNIITYWNDNNLIKNCNNEITCVADNLSKEFDHIYIVNTSYASAVYTGKQDQYSLISHHISMFQKFDDSHKKIKHIITITQNEKWSKIYKYIP